MAWAELFLLDFSAKSPPSTSLSLWNISITSTHDFRWATSLDSNIELDKTANSDNEYQQGIKSLICEIELDGGFSYGIMVISVELRGTSKVGMVIWTSKGNVSPN